MNKKGFTLVELIVVIALIAILSVSVGVGVTNMLNRQDDKQVEAYQKQIENAACTYAELHNRLDMTKSNDTKTVYISELIDDGLISKDLTNPATGEKVSSNTIKVQSVIVKWSNNTKTCTYDLNQ